MAFEDFDHEDATPSEELSLFDISTAVKEPLVWKLDGEKHILKTIDHLSPTEESRLKWLFKKMGDAERRFAACKASEQDKAFGIQKAIDGYAADIVVLVTDLSRDQAVKLNGRAKTVIMQHFTKGTDDEELEGAPEAA